MMNTLVLYMEVYFEILDIKSWPYIVLKLTTLLFAAWASPETSTLPPVIGSVLSSISDCKYQTCLTFSILS